MAGCASEPYACRMQRPMRTTLEVAGQEAQSGPQNPRCAGREPCPPGAGQERQSPGDGTECAQLPGLCEQAAKGKRSPDADRPLNERPRDIESLLTAQE